MIYDFIVLGLGGMGSAACYHLAQRGHQVAGVEQFDLVHERGSSHGQSRIIRKAYFEHPDYVPLLERAYTLWRELEAESKRTLYHETGIVYSCPEDSALLKGLYESSRRYNLPLESLQQTDISKWFQTKPERVLVREKIGGYLEVENCVRAHLEQAKLFGATLYEREAIQNWQATENGVSVQLKNRTLHAKKLILATGAWQSDTNHLSLPLKILKKTMYWFEAQDSTLETSGFPCFLSETPGGIFYGFPQATPNAGLKVAEHSGGEALTHPTQLTNSLSGGEFERVQNFVQSELKNVSTKLLAHKLACMTPDEHFMIDIHSQHANVAFAAGFSGHGFKFASAVGEILADLAERGETKLPIDFLSAKRFQT